MSRHLADHREASEGGRLKNYVEVERTHGEGRHPASKAVHERPATRDDAKKLREFLRIERGIES
ncbi:hypothetical protein OEW28_01665 [Defluviimonas sp. WL0002]|uniref:Uncharacterized protein n=1 Tax=Albidovulum marisflavi TaxID=2984159 RepID=A0ABT2Z864_9RHOB|nr:hypothetical protein [Defluviimonas sp. WL0002]MCV2867334.1 hypothetical protein [Defluviimonas sp. WL0002]